MAEWDSLKFVVRFGVHIVLGGLVFALVAGFSIFLHWLMSRILDGAEEYPYVRVSIEGVEFFIFATDLICVVAFVVKEAWVLLRSLLPRVDTSSVA